MKPTPAKLQQLGEQGHFDFLVPYSKPLLRPDEVCNCLGWKRSYVHELIELGRLESHSPLERQKKRYQVTRRSVVMELAITANYDPTEQLNRLVPALKNLSRAELIQLSKHITQLLPHAK